MYLILCTILLLKWILLKSQIGFAHPQVTCRDKIFLESFVEKVQNLMQSSQNPDLQCQCTRDVSVLTAVEINQDPKLIQEFIVYGVRVD